MKNLEMSEKMIIFVGLPKKNPRTGRGLDLLAFFNA